MIGIDISQQSIKVVVLERSGSDEYRIARAGVSEWQNDPTDSPEDITKKQKHALAALKGTCRIKDNAPVIVSLPSNSIFIRYLDILKSNKKKADDFVKFEAQQQIPFPLEDVAWDHIQIDPKGGNRQAVLMAVKNDLLEGCLDVVRSAKLKTSYVNLGLINLVNCALMSRAIKRNEVGILVDVGAQTTGVVIYKKGELWLRSFSFGSDALIQQVADTVGESFESAWAILSDSPEEAGASADSVREIVSNNLQKIADEVVRSLAFFKSEYARKHGANAEAIDDEAIRLIISGSLVHIGGIADFFSRHTGLSAREFSWSGKISCSAAVAKEVVSVGDRSKVLSESDVPSVFGVAAGAALAEKGRTDFTINFLKHRIATSSGRIVARVFIIGSALFMLMAAGVLGVASFLTMNVNKGRETSLTRVLHTFDIFRSDVIGIINEKERLSQEANFFVSYTSKRYAWVELMSGIAACAPLNIWFDEMDGTLDLTGANKDQVELKGYMLSYDDFNGFLADLKELEVVRVATPEEIESAEKGFKFVLKITLNTLALEKV